MDSYWYFVKLIKTLRIGMHFLILCLELNAETIFIIYHQSWCETTWRFASISLPPPPIWMRIRLHANLSVCHLTWSKAQVSPMDKPHLKKVSRGLQTRTPGTTVIEFSPGPSACCLDYLSVTEGCHVEGLFLLAPHKHPCAPHKHPSNTNASNWEGRLMYRPPVSPS